MSLAWGRHRKEEWNVENITVVLDPGHGGEQNLLGSSSNNAVGPTGTLEKALTLAVAVRLASRLERLGARVLLTRPADRDVNVSAANRAAVARQANANIFLSIHFNGFSDPTVQGTETLVRPVGSRRLEDVDPRSRNLADAVQSSLVNALGHRDRGLVPGRWAVLSERLHHAETARCLAEVSFLTDPEEEARLVEPEYQDRIADALEQAVRTHARAVVPAEGLVITNVRRAVGTGWEPSTQYLGTYDPDHYGRARSPIEDDEGEGDEFDPGGLTIAQERRCEPRPEPHRDDHCPARHQETAGTEHFVLEEFRCRDGTDCPETLRGHLQTLMENLEVLRTELAEPIYIVSGYRTPQYNWQVACGAPRSRHLCGMAADIRAQNHSPQQVAARIEQLITAGRMTEGGLHAYERFVHYDVRGRRARW
jgi:N-acetylmuramoyl-L-alanine amidase